MPSPSLAELLNKLSEQTQAEMNVCIPAEIVSYDAATQLAQVQPCLKRPLRTEDDEEITESMPIISHVPVIHPSGGGFFAHFPLAKGDPVTLIIADRSIDRWLDKGGEVDPGYSHTHELSDAFAIPGGRPDPKKLSGMSSSKLTIGKDGDTSLQIAIDGSAISLSTGSDFVSLAAKVDSELNKIKAAMLTCTVASAPGPVTFASPYVHVSTAATKVKAT